MVHHLFTRTQPKPEYPERADLPHLTDKEASAALCLLRLLVEADVADVYTQPFTPPDERPRWNVWLGHQIRPGGERIELRQWAARSLCVDFQPDGGDA
ncbi:MAG TPA: hypothetical protein VGF38_09980 [Ktedonobacterales bacterium]|jgi:hypothetical protein